MRVLLADKLPPYVAETLTEQGFDVVDDASLSGERLNAAIITHRPEVLVVRSTKVSSAALPSGALGLIVRAGAGTNTIDVAAASAAGVYVANCPGKNSLAVAELTIGLLLSLDRRIPDAVADLRAGRWRKSEYGKARGLAGRSMGVVGCGGIGLAVLQAAAGLGMELHGWNRSPSARGAVLALGGTFHDDLPSMLGACDVVSIHCAATPDTQHLANAAFFDAMRPGAFFLNTSRGSVVDEAALAAAIEGKGLRAGLDVFEGEGKGGEAEIDLPLLANPGVWATPHIGASTSQAQEAVADEALRIITQYRDTGRVPNVVNITPRSPATHLLVVRHTNLVGVLSSVFAVLKDASINVQETENIVFAGGRSCIARIALDSAPSDAVQQELDSLPAVLGVNLVPLGA